MALDDRNFIISIIWLHPVPSRGRSSVKQTKSKFLTTIRVTCLNQIFFSQHLDQNSCSNDYTPPSPDFFGVYGNLYKTFGSKQPYHWALEQCSKANARIVTFRTAAMGDAIMFLRGIHCILYSK